MRNQKNKIIHELTRMKMNKAEHIMIRGTPCSSISHFNKWVRRSLVCSSEKRKNKGLPWLTKRAEQHKAGRLSKSVSRIKSTGMVTRPTSKSAKHKLSRRSNIERFRSRNRDELDRDLNTFVKNGFLGTIKTHMGNSNPQNLIMIQYFDDEGAGNKNRVYSLLRVEYVLRLDPVVRTEIWPSADIRM